MTTVLESNGQIRRMNAAKITKLQKQDLMIVEIWLSRDVLDWKITSRFSRVNGRSNLGN